MLMEQTLGDRMKEYEYVTRNKLTNKLPIVIRLDGKAFHSFTSGMDKPVDDIIARSMEMTTKALCEQVQGVIIGYTQSDEISLVLMNTSDKASQLWFNNNLSKIISVSASICTLEFNRVFMNEAYLYEAQNMFTESRRKYSSKIFQANFDSRAFTLPETEIVNYLIWRQRDCQKNSVSSAARALFSHKSLYGLNRNKMIEKMKNDKNYIFENEVPLFFRNGITFIKEEIERVGTDLYGKECTSTSKRWVPIYGSNNFEDNPEFYLDYIEKAKEW